jgi:hypothetical protein
MNLKSLPLILVLPGLVLIGVACSSGPSEADIEATVQSRIATIPTLTPQIVIQEVIKEVIKEATYTPAPIPTPNIAVTPIPTATPVSPTPESTPVSDLTNTSSEQNNMPYEYSFFHGCSGTGTVMFDQSPMYYEDFISIRPYGQISGAHVTPIDHMYFNPMDRSLGRDSYEVRAIADGVIYYIKPRDISVDSGKQNQENGGWISHTHVHSIVISTF